MNNKTFKETSKDNQPCVKFVLTYIFSLYIITKFYLTLKQQQTKRDHKKGTQ